MKKIYLSFLVALLGMSYANAQDSAVRNWNFTSLSTADINNLTNDTKWKVDGSSRYCYTTSMNSESAIANGNELAVANGLKFTIPENTDGSLRFGGKTAALWMGYKTGSCTMTIPNCKGGQWIVVEYMTSKKSTTRSITATNLATTLPASSSNKEHTLAKAKVVADADVTLSVGEGMYFYGLEVGDSIDIFEDNATSSEDSPENPDNPKDTEHTYSATLDFSNIQSGIFGNGPKIYVSPTGSDSNDGSKDAPYASIQKAVDMAVDPGTTIILAAGEYRPTDRINIDNRNGKHDNYNAMVCLDGRATINCNHPTHGHSDNPYQGIRLTSSYWYFYHIDITNASDNGMLIERNKPTGGSASDVMNLTDQAHDNIIEACNFYKNGDTGLQMKNMAEYNYIINCDSYLNCDEDQGDADGFAPKISVGTGNYFYGCRAYLNSDDGWDVFYKKTSGFGDNQTIILQNCICYKNGFLDENTIADKGNGNGFKCGSDQGAMNVYLNRCIAFNNKAKGFDQNHNSGDIILNNCTSMTTKDNGDKSYSYRIYEAIADGHQVKVTNCIAINDNEAKDKRATDGTRKATEMGKNGDYGRFQIDETLANLSVTTSEFGKAFPSFFESTDGKDLIAARDDNDNLPEMTFGNIKADQTETYSYKVNKVNVDVTASSNDLIDAGTPVENTEYQSLTVPAIKFNGSAPDLGAFETTGSSAGISEISCGHIAAGKVSLNQTMSGMILVTINGAGTSDTHAITVYTTAGTKIAEYAITGSTTAITLPRMSGTAIISIKGSIANESLKISVK